MNKPNAHASTSPNIRESKLPERVGVSSSTLDNWRNPNSPWYDPDFPKKVKFGKRVCVTPEFLIAEWEAKKAAAQSQHERKFDSEIQAELKVVSAQIARRRYSTNRR